MISGEFLKNDKALQKSVLPLQFLSKNYSRFVKTATVYLIIGMNRTIFKGVKNQNF